MTQTYKNLPCPKNKPKSALSNIGIAGDAIALADVSNDCHGELTLAKAMPQDINYSQINKR